MDKQFKDKKLKKNKQSQFQKIKEEYFNADEGELSSIMIKRQGQGQGKGQGTARSKDSNNSNNDN